MIYRLDLDRKQFGDLIQTCKPYKLGQEPWRRSLRTESEDTVKGAERRRLEAAGEEGLEETCPASDAVVGTRPRRQVMPMPDIEFARS